MCVRPASLYSYECSYRRIAHGSRLTPRYFLTTVSLSSFEASVPFAGCPVTLTPKSPREASAALFEREFRFRLPLLYDGAGGIEAHAVGHFGNLSVTSWSKSLSRWMLMETVFVSPCLRVVDGTLKVNVSFWVTVILSSLEASPPFVGCPVTLTLKVNMGEPWGQRRAAGTESKGRRLVPFRFQISAG